MDFYQKLLIIYNNFEFSSIPSILSINFSPYPSDNKFMPLLVRIFLSVILNFFAILDKYAADMVGA
jgi:hypothetical protein